MASRGLEQPCEVWCISMTVVNSTNLLAFASNLSLQHTKKLVTHGHTSGFERWGTIGMQFVDRNFCTKNRIKQVFVV
jgi:hypothetical protein